MAHPYDEQVTLRLITVDEMFSDLLLFEIDQILVVLKNLDVGKRSPGVLNLFCCNCVFGLLGNFSAALLKTTPGPLDLNGSYMIHGESVVLE